MYNVSIYCWIYLPLCVPVPVCPDLCMSLSLLGGSGRVVNSLDLCPASLKFLGCFYFRCVLSSQWKAVTLNLRILYCQLFGGPQSEYVWQQATTCCSCYRMPQNPFFPTNSRSSGQSKNDATTLFPPHGNQSNK